MFFSSRKSQNPSQPQETSDTSSLRSSLSKPLDPSDQSYFHLVQIVGASGRYQTLCLILWCVIWFIAGQLLLGTPFLLYIPPYENCPANIQQKSCSQYVCKLPQDMRQQYVDSKFTSLAMQFGDYHCENSYKIQLTSSLVYFGSFIGYLVVSWMNDNLGRRKSILIGLGVSLSGILLIATSINLFMAQLGLFLAGFGIDPSINTVFYFISQTVQNNSRQKHSTLIQFFFSLAGIVNVINYLIFKNWRVILILFFLLPVVVAVVLVYVIVQETPQFMIMFYTVEETIKALKKMAVANGVQFFQSQQNIEKINTHIQKLKHSYQQKKLSSHKQYFNFWDIFHYPSIRYISIHICILSFSIYLMYYGPLMLIEKYNLNVFVSAIVVTSSEIIVYPIAYVWVDRMRRKLWAKIFYGVAVICAVLLFFVVGSDQMFWKFLEMTLIFVFRFAISFEFVLLAIYETELFPAQIKGLAIGFASALGTIASSLSPVIFGQLQKTSFPVMLIFVFFGSLSFLSSFYLPETLNKRLQQNLQEFGENTDSKQQDNESTTGKRNSMQLVEEIVESDIKSKSQRQEKIFK